MTQLTRELTLEWTQSDRLNTHKMLDLDSHEQPNLLRIGRDCRACDLVLSDSSVSRQHVEIFFKPEWNRFYLRNLQPKNPPRIDGGILIQGEVALSAGSAIELGQMTLTVAAIELLPPPPPQTVLIPPVSSPQNTARNPTPAPSFVLECPSCHHRAPLERRHQACQHCGHFLADAESILLQRGNFPS
ncbi:MAG: FHA domain-containing protein [Cyanobacteriota bacterium]|nr:FHA domain-containing protein [Cyanobacteriota bacterium]